MSAFESYHPLRENAPYEIFLALFSQCVCGRTNPFSVRVSIQNLKIKRDS